ncbi:SurA N-terminal domain-containing protein [Arthrobacter sp. B0490]|uniref:SurA N-terminal domain-containing protein n=1 Tax=Arthrobacter sp. B0490 TaxID=2058891 RepID=UPI000CE39CD9|nr:SurA N-terminal domain-containing protein [Arthrobacter sp. B0490]
MTITRTIQGRRLLAAAFIGSIAVLGGCSAQGGEPESSAASSEAPVESAAPGEAAQAAPDLEGIPEVVAVVNGTDIGREDFTTAYEGQFQQAASQAAASGEEVDQDQLKTTVADNLVSTELLRQEADERGIEATAEARTAAIATLLESSQLGSEEELRAAFAEQGLDDAAFDTQLENQVKLDALLAEEAGDTKPTDQEIQETYDAAVAQQAASGQTATPIPPLEEVRPQIEEQLAGEKTSEAAQSLIGELREGADITVNL